jgi:hypothetical protein
MRVSAMTIFPAVSLPHRLAGKRFSLPARASRPREAAQAFDYKCVSAAEVGDFQRPRKIFPGFSRAAGKLLQFPPEFLGAKFLGAKFLGAKY